jgi:RNA polymerase sigma-70 factor (ECF subfamily)
MLNISQRTVEAQLYKGLKIIRNVLALLALVLFFR